MEVKNPEAAVMVGLSIVRAEPADRPRRHHKHKTSASAHSKSPARETEGRVSETYKNTVTNRIKDNYHYPSALTI
jgi:hypothetical protein